MLSTIKLWTHAKLIYLYEKDLELNNQQLLICPKIQPTTNKRKITALSQCP